MLLYLKYALLTASRKSWLRVALTQVAVLFSIAPMRGAASGHVTRGMQVSDTARRVSHEHLQTVVTFRTSRLTVVFEEHRNDGYCVGDNANDNFW